MGRPGAIVFDFNGTLSHDEPILCEIFMELFAEHGKPLSAQEYFDVLAGLSDPEIVRTWLGRDHPDVDEVIEERIHRYRAAVADGSSVPPELREARGEIEAAQAGILPHLVDRREAAREPGRFDDRLDLGARGAGDDRERHALRGEAHGLA